MPDIVGVYEGSTLVKKRTSLSGYESLVITEQSSNEMIHRYEKFSIIEESDIKSHVTDPILETYPDSLTESDYNIFPELLRKLATKLHGISNTIRTPYDVEYLDGEMIYYLATVYGIEYPLDYDLSQLSLLLSAYPYLRRIRGQVDAIKMMLMVFERSKSDLMNDQSISLDETTVIRKDDGYYLITNGRIKNKTFARYMLKRVIRAGLGFELSAELPTGGEVTITAHHNARLTTQDTRIRVTPRIKSINSYEILKLSDNQRKENH